ncbi:rust resistance kinase Lr10-like [Ziziphus jujuba]|uniref:Rust resistance kinase Lr10-like n=1 Tax=Ziziphus jujuba TaxID=326968 RepID=A0ABM3IJW2_ZIZJJ|nr:rust resistance kinase Lr10-like [Ziziphus jujuba]
MEIGRPSSSPFISLGSFIVLVLMVFHLQTSYAKRHNHHLCPASSCGNIPNISYPFRLLTDPPECGKRRYELSCENNNRSTILYLYSGKYYVQDINYDNYTIRLADFNIDKANCSSVPPYSLFKYNFSYGDPYLITMDTDSESYSLSEAITFVMCEHPVESPLYIPTDPCINSTVAASTTLSKEEYYSYVKVGGTNTSELEDSCRIDQMVMITSRPQKIIWENSSTNISYRDVHNQLVYGFELSWLPSSYRDVHNQLVYSEHFYDHGADKVDNLGDEWNPPTVVQICLLVPGMLLWIALFIGTPSVITFICTWRRQHLSMYDVIEEFLQTNKDLMPVRYSYSDIRKMTKGFKDKLGEGGYGSVYKGKLRSGRFVAIKMLEKSKANGQDFINEVSTIGRIHHVNVVQLVGFCVKGSKRALVYRFMPNGSLDKYLFSQEVSPLDCKRMCEISCGVARGIEYLHRGCNMQILHFDIKPHNILLDENFIPKVSDFGLARLSPLGNSIVSLTAVRGTMGYIAPELVYKNIGVVSNKADVYSFGMLLMEMASRRKNLNAGADHTSQIYFPSWIYDQFKEGNEVEMGDATKDESKIRKKMIIVAFWCIQMNPNDRPTMSRVKKMLEGDVDSLQMPPKPFVCPQEKPIQPVNDEVEKSDSRYSTMASYHEDSEEISQIIQSS